jgi:hypothetical protein
MNLCEYQQRLPWRVSAVDVDATPKVILGGNSRRVCVQFFDQGGAGDIYVRPGGQASATQGILLGALGTGQAEFWAERYGSLPASEWWASAAGGIGTVFIIEILYQ